MTAETFGVSLPLFDDDTPMAAALDDPAVIGCGAIISTDGGDGYWLHSVSELRAGRSRLGESATFEGLRSTGRELRPSTIRAATAAGLELKVPSTGEMADARRAFRADMGIDPLAHAGAHMKSALVFARSIGNFVIVGKTYFCSKFREAYDQADYDLYNGKCPKHAGATLDPKR
jgi:hypothetical protein